MEVFHQLEELSPLLKSSSVAIGNFDGVHRGHTALLKGMCADAQKNGLTPAVLTFFPHPVEVLNPSKVLERLTTTSEKLEQLERMGVELVLVASFTSELANLEPQEFYRKFLLSGMAARSVHVGFNFCFGRGRAGDTATLADLCRQDGIRLQVFPPFEVDGVKVSSSTIRQFIREGKVEQALVLLDRPYVLAGQVIHGEERGSKLGFPTANLHFAGEKVLPKRGVYYTRVRWQGQWYRSVTNVGVRPTFSSHLPPAVSVEVHLLDFGARLYDEWLKVEFIRRLRDEQKFASVEALRLQIQQDVETAKSFSLFES